MYQSWIWSTRLFVLSLVIFGLGYYITDDTLYTALVTVIAVSVIALATIDTILTAVTALVFIVLSTTVIYSATSFVWALVFASVLSTALTLLSGMQIAIDAANDENDSHALCYIAIMPYGIGFVFGGLILLFRKKKVVR